jgi:radical SAM superfamily enzyme YgiQ (UPF0313 family)
MALITLINPPQIKNVGGLQMHSPNPPLGLAYIAACTKQAGYECIVVDGTGEALDSIRPYPDRDDFLIQGLTIEEIVERIPENTDIIGVSCMFSSLWPITRILCDSVRKAFPDVLIVGGGEHMTAVPEYVLSNSAFDALVLGEGEHTFQQLITKYVEDKKIDGISGVAYIDNGNFINSGLSPRNKSVEEIPFPDWDAIPIEEYISRHQTSGINLGRSLPMIATRGCPYECTFCSNPFMWTRRYITRDPKSVVDEMELHSKKYNIVNFDLYDLTAIVKRSWAIKFTKELISRDLNITWQMPSGTRSEIFDEEVADLLYRSGCRAMSFAPESGSKEILKDVKKQVDLENLEKAVKVSLKRGFKLSCFIVIGFPSETVKSLDKSLKFIRKLAFMGVHDIAVSKFVPYPGSELFRQLQANGKIEFDDAFFVSPMDFYTTKAPSYSDNISSKRLYLTMLYMFSNFYILSFILRPYRVLHALTLAVFSGKEETRYAKWFVDKFFTRRKWKKVIQNID